MQGTQLFEDLGIFWYVVQGPIKNSWPNEQPDSVNYFSWWWNTDPDTWLLLHSLPMHDNAVKYLTVITMIRHWIETGLGTRGKYSKGNIPISYHKYKFKNKCQCFIICRYFLLSTKDIANMDKCWKDKCCLDKYHHNSWHLLDIIP